MNEYSHQHSLELRVLLRGIQVISLVGLLYSAGQIANGQALGPDWRPILHATWFAVVAASAQAILEWYRLGVYLLVGVTLLVTIIDLAYGWETMGEVSLMLALTFILVSYVVPKWWKFE